MYRFPPARRRGHQGIHRPIRIGDIIQVVYTGSVFIRGWGIQSWTGFVIPSESDRTAGIKLIGDQLVIQIGRRIFKQRLIGNPAATEIFHPTVKYGRQFVAIPVIPGLRGGIYIKKTRNSKTMGYFMQYRGNKIIFRARSFEVSSIIPGHRGVKTCCHVRICRAGDLLSGNFLHYGNGIIRVSHGGPIEINIKPIGTAIAQRAGV